MIKGNRSVLQEGPKFKRWIGVCPVRIIAVNPDASKIMEMFPSRTDWGQPEYLQQKDYKGGLHKYAIVDIYMKGIVPDDTEPIFNLRINLVDSYMFNKDKTKVEVIDKYAQTTWLPIDDVKKHLWKDEWASRIDKDSYRPAIVGEATLMMFLQKYLAIPNVQKYDFESKTWSYKEGAEKDECECQLDDIKKVFKGDFSEILDIFKGFEENMLKVMVGIRFSEDGRIFQRVNDRVFATINSYSLKPFEREVANQNKFAEESGTTPNVIYSAEFVHEYEPAPAAAKEAEEEVEYATSVEETGVTPQPMPDPKKPKTDLFESSNNDDLPF